MLRQLLRAILHITELQRGDIELHYSLNELKYTIEIDAEALGKHPLISFESLRHRYDIRID